ncbi:hypothetical protein [Paenibacillus alginolyticus]|uniref:Uncharacterized protein n=1 Tax=Paenibacillus alginolyticus TaxID=59839 RepID=A0ABT4G9D6_9BACL|nr:hypothetical protein [Paenibacillus alginolyticus]MCY9692797.1 hypothetical protein [Paenibacillus alginolyticus]MEC0146117.1 hypothetical protein [Paenibacillus alginolyticus]
MIISLLLQGGIFVISSPIEFYLEVNRGLGFTEVPEALHWDYGPDLPSKTLMLDVRGDKLHSYIKNMITASAILLYPKLSEGMFELTEW